MEKKPPPPLYFKTKKWAVSISSAICVWLWYQFAERTIDNVDSKEYQSNMGFAADESTAEWRHIKRWTKIAIVLLSGAAIVGQICGIIGGFRQYRFIVAAHVFINLLLVMSLAVWLAKLLLLPISPNSSDILLFDYQIDFAIKILILLIWTANIAVGILFRRDLLMMHYAEKLSRCTCPFIHAQQINQSGQNPQAPQSYVTTDGSRYIIPRQRPPSSAGDESWMMMPVAMS